MDSAGVQSDQREGHIWIFFPHSQDFVFRRNPAKWLEVCVWNGSLGGGRLLFEKKPDLTDQGDVYMYLKKTPEERLRWLHRKIEGDSVANHKWWGKPKKCGAWRARLLHFFL